MSTEQDSYQQYKKYLQDSLGISGIPVPPRPLTPYQRFLFQRNCQQKSKGNKQNMTELSKGFGDEWKKLDDKKKEYYQKIFDVRNRQRQDLVQEYQFLTKKRKVINGYTRYFKKRFKDLSKQNPKVQINEINKMVASDWKNLSQSEKNKYNKEAENDQAKHDITNEQRQSRIQQYNQSIKKFADQLKEQKQKVLKKFGLHNVKEQRRLEREKQRQLQKQQKKQQKDKKRKEQVDAKKKERQETRKKQLQQKKKQQQQKKKQVKQKSKKQVKQTKEVKEPKQAKQVNVKQVKQPKKAVAKTEKKPAQKAAPKPKKKAPAKKAKPVAKKPAKKETKKAPAAPKKTKKIAKAPKAAKKPAEKARGKKQVKSQQKQVKKEVKKQVKEEVVKIEPSKARTSSKSKPKGRK